MLSGDLEPYDGTAWKTGRTGISSSCLRAHGFTVESYVSMLLTFTPGAPARGPLRGLPGLAETPMTDEEQVELMLRHDTYWV